MQTLLLALCCTFYLASFSLYHLMVFRVNKNLPLGEKIPHSLTFGDRERLGRGYRALYPRSILYQLTLLCAVTVFVLAVAFSGFRIWDAAH